jgi:biopolymer transport protein ExbB
MRSWQTLVLAGTTLLFNVMAFAVTPATSDWPQRIEAAQQDYLRRVEQATAELNATRERLARERVPIVAENRSLQQQVVALETELMLLQTEVAQAENERQRQQVAQQELTRNLHYLRQTINERLQDLAAHLQPGDPALAEDRLRHVRTLLDDSNPAPEATVAGYQLVWDRIETLLGGHRAPGEALADGSNVLQPGEFLVAGPASYFRAQDGNLAGLARPRDGGHAVVYAVPGWTLGEAAGVAGGELGLLPVDVQGGKALRLAQAQGNWRAQLEKGGMIGYAILLLGAVALVIVIWKLVDLSRMRVDAPARVRPVLSAVRQGAMGTANQAAGQLRATTRELFVTALEHADRPKLVLEEQLYALIMRWRLFHERRLPLLAVIVTASPLLGLLGTVTGMVKTFTLITVFGTGNADKLASGISEALVTTQLGLTIAIPTLIVYGFLSQRVKKRLALLERYAVEFVAAADLRRDQGPVINAPA